MVSCRNVLAFVSDAKILMFAVWVILKVGLLLCVKCLGFKVLRFMCYVAFELFRGGAQKTDGKCVNVHPAASVRARKRHRPGAQT